VGSRATRPIWQLTDSFQAYLIGHETFGNGRIDELHLERPFYGSRKVSVALRAEGLEINRKHVRRLMRLMGLEAMVPKPTTSEPHPEHPVYPYLLRDLTISRPDHVWASDITYVPMKTRLRVFGGHHGLVLAPRSVVEVVQHARFDLLRSSPRGCADKFGNPEIFNTDQGSQFIADAFTKVLRARGIAISMDGKGRCLDNVFVERLWRSLKYEEVYLHVYDTVTEARAGIGRYLTFYNGARPHQARGYQTPHAFYRILRTRAA
jgi:putative transposase